MGQGITRTALERITVGLEGARHIGSQISGWSGTNVQLLLESAKAAVDGKSNLGHTHAGSEITSGTVGVSFIGSGTKDATTYYRGDGTFAVPPGSGGGGYTFTAVYPAPATISTGRAPTSTEYLLLCNAASGNMTIPLPTAVGIAGKEYAVKKIDSTTNTVTIDPNSTQTIDGKTTIVTALQYDCVVFQSDGANWFIKSSPA